MIECWNKRQCGVNDCDRNHHASLHNAYVSGHTLHSTLYDDCIISSSYCMLPIMVIKASLSENFMNVLFDEGSTISLITFSAARRLGLRKVMLSAIKVGEQTESCEYIVCLDDSKGANVFLRAYGIP